LRPAFLFLVLSVPAWAWQEPQSNPQLALIRQVRQRMAENLTALPNYTCLETTDRSVRNQVKQKLLFRDKIHLEVAFIEASELFCWPGSAHFESDLLQQLPQAGASAADFFVLHCLSRHQRLIPTKILLRSQSKRLLHKPPAAPLVPANQPCSNRFVQSPFEGDSALPHGVLDKPLDVGIQSDRSPHLVIIASSLLLS